MLDPELIDALAARPEDNAPAVNRALAEEGHGTVLVALAQSAATAADALAVIARRLVEEDPELDAADEDDRDLPLTGQLEQLLVGHPNSPDDVRDLILDSHPDESLFVIAAASHPRATRKAIERAARWPSRFAVYDRPWLLLVPDDAIATVAATWAGDASPLLREAVALRTDDPALLARLADDPDRRVRRAVASNPRAVPARAQLAEGDPAPEVRARAAGEPGPLRTQPSAEARAAAKRAMDRRGALAPDVVEALSRCATLDEEGAFHAARVLPPRRAVSLIAEATSGQGPAPICAALGAGLALRAPEASEAFRSLVTETSKALGAAGIGAGKLTGKARLADWLGEGLAICRAVDPSRLVDEITPGSLGSEPAVLGRSEARAPKLLARACHQAASGERVAPAWLELAWRQVSIDDATVLAIAERVAGRAGRTRSRGPDIADEEIDLDPKRRSLELLERVVLAASGKVTFTPRAALPVVSLDSRRVRYVLTALPSWRGELRGAMLGRVFRQRAGALSAARSETRSRRASLRDWTQRMLSDTEVGVAMAVGHFTADALIHRVSRGRHRVQDGASIAAGAETRAVLEGPESIASLVGWASEQRGRDDGALALWLLLEDFDRRRAAGQIAAGVDTIARRATTISTTVVEALASLERRQPGRLDRVFAQSPRGRATVASALARAYRSVGGSRGER